MTGSYGSNQDLQATHGILSLFEKSNLYSSRILDNIGTFFVIIDGTGAILRGNIEAGKLFGVSHEKLLSRNLSELFKPEAWSQFSAQIRELDRGQGAAIELELPVDRLELEGGPPEYLWTLSRMRRLEKDNLDLFSVVGKDVGALKKALRSVYSLELVRRGLEQEVQSKRIIQLILDNLDESFMMFDEKGVILSEVSKAALKIFGSDPQGKSLIDVLGLTGAAADSCTRWLQAIYSDLRIDFEDLMYFGPKTFERGDDLYVKLSYRPVRSPEGGLEKVIFTATDKTKERKLEVQTRIDSDRAKMAMAILQDRSMFSTTVADITGILAKLEAGFAPTSDRKLGPREVMRLAHSGKGCAATFYITEVKDGFHRFEGRIQEAAKAGRALFEPEECASFLEDVRNIHRKWDGYLSKLDWLIKKEADPQERLRSFPMSRIQLMAADLEKQLGADHSCVQTFKKSFLLQPAHELFERFIGTARSVAEGQGKRVRVEIVPSEVKVLAQSYEPFLLAAVHIFRNGVDHGIEHPSDREMFEKPAEGTIKVSISEKSERVLIRVEDDGRGIDPDVIRRVAAERNVRPEAELASMAPEQLIQLIFEPGFSSVEAQDVSDVSGRGIGLDAVKTEVVALGGSIEVSAVPRQGTRFLINLPKIDRLRAGD